MSPPSCRQGKGTFSHGHPTLGFNPETNGKNQLLMNLPRETMAVLSAKPVSFFKDNTLVSGQKSSDLYSLPECQDKVGFLGSFCEPIHSLKSPFPEGV